MYIEIVTISVVTLITLSTLILLVIKSCVGRITTCPSSERVDGKTILITGGNSGIGLAAAKELAKRGGRIIIASRDETKSLAAVSEIQTYSENKEIYHYYLDLSSLTSVKKFATTFLEKHNNVDILINNAAQMGSKSMTEDGFEKTYVVNYLGHFLLTNLLLLKMSSLSSCRIINVISGSYADHDFDINNYSTVSKENNIYKAYAISKLALVFFSRELHERYSDNGVVSVGVNPGVIHTNLLRDWPGFVGKLLRGLARVAFRSPYEGCQSIVYCSAYENSDELSGNFIANCKPIPEIDNILNVESCKKLWALSKMQCEAYL